MTMNDQKSLNGFMKNWESKNNKKNIQPKRESTTHSREEIEGNAFKIIQNFIRMYSIRKEFKKKLKVYRYRKRVVDELLNTERTYVNVLNCIVDLFIKPIGENNYISQEDTREIFSNVEIIQRVNSTLLIDLSDRIENWSPTRQIGDVFIQLSDFFKVYIDYVKNYNNAIARLNECKKDEDFQKFLKVQMFKVEKYERDELQSLLINPVQRIPRYALLISDLLRHTPEDHPDYSNLQTAQEKLKSTASYVNSRAEHAIELTKIYTIQNSIYGKFDSFLERDRRLIRDGFAKQYTPMKKRKIPIYIILFNDCLICCKNDKKTRNNTQKFEFISQIPLFSSFLVQYPDDPLHGNINCFSLETRKEKCFISCETLEEKQQWIAEINKQILETNEKFQFYEAKKDEVSLHKAEEARALIAEKYTTMRVRGTSSENEFQNLSGKRRFASLRKPASPLQKYENIETAKLSTENLLREEEENLHAKQLESEKRSEDFKESTALKYQRSNSEDKEILDKESLVFRKEKKEYKMRAWSLKRKKSKEKLVDDSKNNHDDDCAKSPPKFHPEGKFMGDDFELELAKKLKERTRSNSTTTPPQLADIPMKAKSEDDLNLKPPTSPQLRSWALRTRTAYIPRKQE